VRRAVAACALLLAGCASAPPPSATLASEAHLEASTIPGQATRASVQAALGATRVQSFDSGYQVWMYQLARPGGRYAEFVILFGPDGVVRRTRQREPGSLDPKMN
jgi:hypothetical protein